MNTTIKHIIAREIIDSRGYPTIETKVVVEDSTVGVFSVPSGASIGIYEALELRDGDTSRYDGKGVLTAVENVNTIIAKSLEGKDASKQKEIDQILIELDGTNNKSKLGANAILSVSFAVCRASAASQQRKLYNYINSLLIQTLNVEEGLSVSMPTPLFNVLNGGAHADNSLSIQEFIIVPKNVKTFKEQLRAGVEIDHHLKRILKERGATTGVGDEGGFAPNLPNDEIALDYMMDAVEVSGYTLGSEILFGLDIAASQYWEEDDKVYAIPNISQDKVLVDKPEKMGNFYINLLQKYPIFYIEDPLAEDDWDGWKSFAKQLDFSTHLLVGDDLTATNPQRVEKAAQKGLINGVIIKPNQIGTLTEVFAVIKICKNYGLTKIISHRSGETTDTFIADLAVACNAQYIKDGAPIRGERVAKYNRLLEIEQQLYGSQQKRIE